MAETPKKPNRWTIRCECKWATPSATCCVETGLYLIIKCECYIYVRCFTCCSARLGSSWISAARSGGAGDFGEPAGRVLARPTLWIAPKAAKGFLPNRRKESTTYYRISVYNRYKTVSYQPLPGPLQRPAFERQLAVGPFAGAAQNHWIELENDASLRTSPGNCCWKWWQQNKKMPPRIIATQGAAHQHQAHRTLILQSCSAK